MLLLYLDFQTVVFVDVVVVIIIIIKKNGMPTAPEPPTVILPK